MRTGPSRALARPPAVFLDRDGVVNENRDDHVKCWQEFRFLPGSLDALRLLTERGCAIYIVTNQAAINRGLVSAAVVEAINRRMVAVAALCGGRILDVRHCPHRPDEACPCRKPRPGMLLSLAAAHGIDTRDAFMVGDALTDVQAGHAVGCHTVLVRTGRGTAQLAELEAPAPQPDHVAGNLLEAARWIDAQLHHGPHLPWNLHGVSAGEHPPRAHVEAG
jgi:D-glycero-D-manno-heptose 1,7-bisphosphate phosphatase